MKNFEKLNKNEMKMILGGDGREDVGGGDKYQCCPDLSSPNVSCSDCRAGTPETLTCTIGTLRKC